MQNPSVMATYRSFNPSLQVAIKLAVAFLVVMALVILFQDQALATTTTGAGTEFNASATKFETWLKGGYGKMAALLSLLAGVVVFAWTKDYKWLIGGIVISVVVGVIISVITASFTAII